MEACKRAERGQEAEPQWAWRLRKRTGRRACKRAGQRATEPRDQGTKGPRGQRTKGPKDQRTKGPKTKQEAFVARRGILEACRRAERAQEAEPQWAWRLRKRTGKRACKRAMQGTTGPRDHGTTGPRDHGTT